MPINITDVDTFTDPATRPAGTDVRNAASVQGPFQALANRTRWLYNRIVAALGGVSGTGEWAYEDGARTRLFQVPLHTGAPVPGSSFALSNPGSGHYWQNLSPSQAITFPLSELLRDGQTLSAVRVLIKPAADLTVGAACALFSVAHDFTTPADGTPSVISGVSSSGVVLQVVPLTGLATTVVRKTVGATLSRDYFLRITTSDGSGDLIHGIELEVEDPGPANV